MPLIYFSGSISGGREDIGLYIAIVERLRAAGVEVLAGEVTNPAIGSSGESGSPREIFDRDLGWIAEAANAGGVLVAEVSRPSTGVGYEIACARYKHDMPVICLWRPKHTQRCTAMIEGDPGIRLLKYDEGDVDELVGRLLEEISRMVE